MLSQIQVGFYNLIKTWPETWASSAVLSVGDIIKPTTYNNYSYKVTTAGTTGSSEPSWATTIDATISSGTVVFTTYDTKTHNLVAPQAASVPYITFGLETEVPMGDFEDFEAIENMTFWVNAFSDKSVADVSEIADEVMDALDGATITASGFTSMKCVREFIGTPIFDGEVRIYQIPMRFRALLDKT